MITGTKKVASPIIIFLLLGSLFFVNIYIRLNGLKKIDLCSDEALSAEISMSLLKYGELNNFRYSKFVHNSQFRHNIWIYYPPVFYFIQSPFMLLKDSFGSNIAPRLSPLLSNSLMMILLYFLCRDIFGNKTAGLACSFFITFNSFNLGMSRYALPYSLLPGFLCLTLWFLIKYLSERNSESNGIWAAAFLVVTFYTHQQALLFGFVCLGAFFIWLRRNKKIAFNFILYLLCAFVACFIWIVFFMRSLIIYQTFFLETSNYSFVQQVRNILLQFRNMIPTPVLQFLFFLGMLKMLYAILVRKKTILILIIVWLSLPLLFLFTRNTWIKWHHFHFVFPPVAIVTAYGMYTFVEFILNKTLGRKVSHDTYAYQGAAILFLCLISLANFSVINTSMTPAAKEFGDPSILSRASKFIRENYKNEIIIAPVGNSESYYLGKYVYDKNKPNAAEQCFDLISKNSTWVFMGDNYFKYGKLDAFDLYVKENGNLIMHSKPVKGFTDENNSLGYALYYIEKKK